MQAAWYLCRVKPENRLPVVGILGGGQLGRMLIQAAVNYNLEVHVLDPDPAAPASELAQRFVNGSFADHETVLQFGRQVDVLTVEIEHVNTAALRKLEEEGKRVFPQASVLEMVQDKGIQKQFFERNGFPTSGFVLVEGKAELEKLDDSWFPCFQKLRTSGYDGRGVVSLQRRNDLAHAFDAPSVVEKAVAVEREFAVIVAANGTGSRSVFPPVDMVFHPTANLVEFLSAPSELPIPVQEEAGRIALEIAEACGIQGLLAVEFFLDTSGRVLVNEIAPRPHNSGHHTIEGNRVSQFEQHLRAILGWPLGDTATLMPAVMVNILGEPGYSGEAVYKGLKEVVALPGVYVHLYGKKITKPFRKMGHATVTHTELVTAKELAREIQARLKVISRS